MKTKTSASILQIIAILLVLGLGIFLVDVDKLILPDDVSLSDEMQNRTLFYFEGLGTGEWVDLTIAVSMGEPVDLVIMDSSFGLPSFSEALVGLLPPGVLLGHAEMTVYTAASFGTGK